jgi:hypothetical protein
VRTLAVLMRCLCIARERRSRLQAQRVTRSRLYQVSVYDVANAVGPYRYSDPGVRPKAVRKVETPCRILLSRR